MTPSAILSAKTRSETRFILPGPRPHTGFADTVRALPSNMRTGRSHILCPPLFPHSHPHPPVVGSHADCPRLRYDRLAFRKRLRPKRSDRSSTEFLPENARRRTLPTPTMSLRTTIGKPERMPAKATKLFSDRAFRGAPLLHNIRPNVPTGVEYRAVISRGSGNRRLRHPQYSCGPPLGN